MQFMAFIRINAVFLFAICHLVCGVSAWQTKTPSQNQRPNIILFLVDDQRNDTLGCAGHPIVRTPAIDSLAADGIRFERAYVTTSICAASRASILTGLCERTHGYTFGTPPLSEVLAAKSYPALLRENGYRTGFVGKLGVRIPGKAIDGMFDYFRPLGRTPYFHTMPDGTKRHETDLAADHAIEFIREGPPGIPYALSVSFNAVHAEDNDHVDHYPSPSSVDGMYEDTRIPPPPLSDPAIFNSLPDFLQQSMNRDRYYWRWDTPGKYQRNMKAYYRMLSGVDSAIARVIDEIRKAGADQNTVILYMSDNGYYMGNRGFAGKWSHFEESLRIPLIIHDPRAPTSFRGQTSESIVLNLDIAPTFLEIAGIDTSQHDQGHSLLPLVYGKQHASGRTRFFCEHLMEHDRIPKWEGVHGERYVYARYFGQQPVYEFLHDLAMDPDQLTNFSGDEDYQALLKRMRTICDAFVRDR